MNFTECHKVPSETSSHWPKKGTCIENNNIPQDAVQPKGLIQYRLEVQMHSTATPLDSYVAFDFDLIYVMSRNWIHLFSMSMAMSRELK